MNVTIDENKILTEIIERDGSLHEKIKQKVEEQLIDKVVDEIELEFMKQDWYRNNVKIVEDRESEQALILETAYNLGYHKIKDGCLQEPLEELNKLITTKVNEEVIKELESIFKTMEDNWKMGGNAELAVEAQVKDRIRTLKENQTRPVK